MEANVPGESYWFFTSGNVGGAFAAHRTPSRESVMLTLKVDDIEVTLALIAAHGGSVIRGRSRIGQASPGYDAYVLDPNGNQIGLY